MKNMFVQRPIFAAVIAILIALVGVLSIPGLPVEQTPDITPPTVVVSASYPGASADVIAETVAAPIEEQVNGVENMIYMSSKSSDNGSMELTVTFEIGTDIDMATVLVQNRVAIAEARLPEEVRRRGIVIKKKSTSIVFMVNLVSPDGRYDEIFMSNYITTRIKDVLGRVSGVGDVSVLGAKDFGMRVWLDPELLRIRGLTTDDVASAIREQNVQVAAGQIGAPPSPPGQEFQYVVRTLGRLSTPDEFGDIVIKTDEEGRALRVKDVARVELGAETYDWYVELNGAPSIAMAIYQLPGANALDVASGVTAEMDRLARDFPEGLEYSIPYDTTLFISSSIKEVLTTLLIAMILVILSVYIFLQDFRATIIPSIAILVSLTGTFAIMGVLGVSINTLSLFGLVLAIGIVVDDSIVVVENTVRILDTNKGISAKEAAAKTMGEVTGPVIATTAVLLAVFVPTAMMGGITGRLYSQFALTISGATVLSSVCALSLAPALAGILLRPTPVQTGFFAKFNSGFERVRSRYTGTVRRSVTRFGLPMALFGALVVLLVVLFGRIPSGFIPDEDQGIFLVSAQLPDGATLERTSEVMDRIGEILAGTPGVADYVTIGGFSMIDGIVASNMGAVFVSLEPWGERGDKSTQLAAILGHANGQLAQIQDGVCFAFIPPAIMGLGATGGFTYQLQDVGGVGLVGLQQAADDLVQQGNADLVLTRVNSSFRATVPQLYLDIDRVKAKKLGVSLQTIFNTLQAYLGSMYVNDFTAFGRIYRVITQADQSFRDTVEDIGRLQVRDAQGNMVPLGTLLAVEEVAGPQTVFRYNLYPTAKIIGNPAPGYSSGQSIAAMEAISDRTLPQSMSYEWTGMTYQEIEAGAQVAFIFILAFVFAYLFLAAQYESWAVPMAIIIGIPVAIFGAMLAIGMRGFVNDVYTQIGIVLLIGLSAKTAILIAEFAKQRHEEGLSVIDAAVEAADLRFRAILMTAVSFILGVFPLVIASGAGANSRRVLGTAVFGGMLAATVIGVFTMPVLYRVIQGGWEKLTGETPKAAAAGVDAASDEVPSASAADDEPSA